MRTVVIGLVMCSAWSGAAAQAPTLAIENITIVDVNSGRRHPNQTILISGDRITTVGQAQSVQMFSGARRIDARGLFAIPGLWDMHVHAYRSLDAAGALHLANGVTGVRDMGARFGVEPVLRLRDSIRSGAALGPRMIVGGAVADRMTGVAERQLDVTPVNAGAVVNSLVRADVDFIKVTSLSSENFRALYPALRVSGIPWAGHVPASVDLREALDNGLASHEHLWGVLPSCSAREDSLRRVIADTARRLRGLPNLRAEAQVVEALSAHFDEPKCVALIRLFVQRAVAATPTLLVYRQLGWPGELADTADSRLRYVAAEERERWLEFRKTPPWTADMPEQRTLFHRYAELLRRMARDGVMLLAGSDAGFGFLYHGFSVHDELATLVTAGLTSLQALQAATINPARYLGATDSLGTIERGKLADIVLLDADPLENIRNTTRVRAVIAGGRYLDRFALDQLLEDAARRAGSASR